MSITWCYDLTYKWNLTNQRSKQNRIRDMEIKNKLTVTRGEDNGGKKEKGNQGTCKGPMDKDNRARGRTECVMWGWVGQGRVMGETWE